MIKSVIKFKGFYVGRYELSINKDTKTGESKDGVIPSFASDEDTKYWYGLYRAARSYRPLSYSDTSESCNISTDMLWGSQAEVIRRWSNMEELSDTFCWSRGYNRKACGLEKKDFVNNIYDFLYNYPEWTQECDKDRQKEY